MVSYLCGICEKTIDDDKESSILCDICNSWIHLKCNHLSFFDFQHVSGNNNDSWFCFKCTCKIFPIGNLNNQNFHWFIHNLDIDKIQKMKIEPNSLFLFHINSWSLNKYFEDLEYLLRATNKIFDVIAISESRILKDTNLSKNINIYNYSDELLQLNLIQVEPYFILTINYLTCLDKVFVFINQVS